MKGNIKFKPNNPNKSSEKHHTKKIKIIDIISIMPGYFESPLKEGLLSKAVENGIIEINIINPRDFSENKHKKVDGKIYGGGAGRLLMAYPILRAHNFAVKNYSDRFGTADKNDRLTAIMSPSGKLLDSGSASSMSSYDHIIIICGRYEGIDARVVELTSAVEVSIGNFILSGGEIASLVFIETIGRYFKGFMGNPESLSEESFSGGLLEYPQYTSPRTVKGLSVPEVLLSGNHELIKQWRINSMVKKTYENHPDLIREH